ncbi:MAG: amino acid synthesis family protein [Microbacteriaceae bacterium]|nr:MAG: amino acid synthesis family protein [Microbacteriaceae bacterium]
MTFTTTESARVDLSTRSTLHAIGDLAAAIGLRGLATTREEIPTDGRRPIMRAGAVAVIGNPWVGTGNTTDLGAATRRIAPVLAKLLTDRLVDMLGGARRVGAFGKAAVVGTGGEIEHAAALIHTPYFGNLLREALKGTSILCFVDGTAQPGETLRVPMWHKTAAATRDYYQTIDLPLPNAPHHDEIAVIAVASTGPRPFARIGDRTTDEPVTSDILKGFEL